MRLADDLMEPFRPFIDLAVYRLVKDGQDHVTPDTKRTLVSVMEAEVANGSGATPLKTAVQDMASSLGQIFEGKTEKLLLPDVQLPLLHHPS